MLFPEFEVELLAYDSHNDGKATLTDEQLLKEGHEIISAQGLSENNTRLSNGVLHQCMTRHGI